MMLDSIQIIHDLIKEFGEGEVSVLSYDFIEGIELGLVAKNHSVSHRFKKEVTDNAQINVMNREYQRMFTQLKKAIKDASY